MGEKCGYEVMEGNILCRGCFLKQSKMTKYTDDYNLVTIDDGTCGYYLSFTVKVEKKKQRKIIAIDYYGYYETSDEVEVLHLIGIRDNEGKVRPASDLEKEWSQVVGINR